MRFPRAWWSLSFKDNDLESSFIKYYNAKSLDKNLRLTVVCAVAMALISIIYYLFEPSQVYKLHVPVILATSLFLLITWLTIRFARVSQKFLMQHQHHVFGATTSIAMAVIMIGGEYAQIPFAREGADNAMFEPKLRHMSAVAIYIAVA
ncbi:hypothetical protein HDU88_007864 [Geranomyces variabilis]|nr:hypothetical protein HDU88_007864 [Geranomyces variabilis]